MLKPNPRPKLFGLAVAMMIGVVIPDGAAADSEKSALEKQIIDEVVLTVNAYLDRGVPVSHDSEASAGYWQARGVGSKISSKYQKLKPQKALAVCIAWEASHLGGIVVRSFGGSMRSAHLSSAIETAIFHCEKSRARGGITDCECAVLAENDKLILGVPESFLSRAIIPRQDTTPGYETPDEYGLTRKVLCDVPGEGQQILIYSSCLSHNGEVLEDAP